MIYVTQLLDFSNMQIPGGVLYPYPFYKSEYGKNRMSAKSIFCIFASIPFKFVKANPDHPGQTFGNTLIYLFLSAKSNEKYKLYR